MMKKIRLTLILIFFQILIPGILLAQLKVTGNVTDAEEGIALPGVTILEKNSGIGAITNIDGNYEITVPKDAILVFSYVGYAPQEIVVGTQTLINIQLQQHTELLDEIIVIGYGTVKKEDATGSVITIGADDFNKGAITSAQDLLVGKAAGVVITSQGGAPGSGPTIRIRGGSSLRASNDPLIVIDGIPMDNSGIAGMANPLSFVNPNDIESFTVLKDASATAIYGSRASNGVIIITTKKGKKGEIRASYNGSVSLGVPVEYMDVYSGDEFRSLIQDRVDNHGLTDVALDRLGTANTDWQKEIYQNSFSQNHNVSVSGSPKDIPFRVSFGNTRENGILKYSSMERTTVDISVNPSLLDDALKINLNGKGMFTNNDFSNTGAIGAAIQFDPTQPITNGNTRYGGYTAWTELSSGDPLDGDPNNIATHNPVALLEYKDNTSKVQRYIGNAQVEYIYPALPELKATLKTAYDYFSSDGDNNNDPRASWSEREPERNVTSYSQIGKNSLLDLYLNYNKDISSIESKVDITGGYSWQHYYREGDNANRPWDLTDGVYVNSDTTSYKNEYYMVSFFGRMNYSFKDRYLLTATVRYDGSSRFSEDNRWGLFPAFAFAWKIKEEGFLANLDVISDLKLRIGYGITGQQDIPGGLYPYIPAYTISQQGAYYQMGDTFYPTQRPDAYDANIKWEETTTQNIGLDFGLFNNRIIGSFDYYKRVTDNLINEVPVAAGTNFSNFLVTNVGSLENTGFEAALTLRPISKADMSWEISTNFTYNVNEITKLTLVDDPDYTGYDVGGISGGVGNHVQINAVTYGANTFFLFRQVYDADGMPIEGLYVDKTGDGGNVAGNNLNKYYLQSPAPEYLIGLSSRFNYKDFDFSFSGRFNIGNYVYNNNASHMALYQNVYNQSGYVSNILTDVEKTEFTTAQFWSDFYLENASFFRMDNISLGYSFDKLFTEKLDGRVSFTVQNAFVITKYSGLDPEVDGGIDNNIFPRPRTFVLGLNLNF